jgi:hypothetical protein
MPVEVPHHLVRDDHARVGVDGIDVDGQEGHVADPRLVLHLDHVVAEPDDEVGAAQELALVSGANRISTTAVLSPTPPLSFLRPKVWTT